MIKTIARISACVGALLLSLSILPAQAEGTVKNKDGMASPKTGAQGQRQGITDNNSPLPRDRAKRTNDAAATTGRNKGIRLEPVGSSLKKN